MLLLIMTFGIILIINVIVALNNFDYEWIINEFCNQKYEDKQYFNNYEDIIFFGLSRAPKIQDQTWVKVGCDWIVWSGSFVRVF